MQILLIPLLKNVSYVTCAMVFKVQLGIRFEKSQGRVIKKVMSKRQRRTFFNGGRQEEAKRKVSLLLRIGGISELLQRKIHHKMCRN